MTIDCMAITDNISLRIRSHHGRERKIARFFLDLRTIEKEIAQLILDLIFDNLNR